MNGHRPEDHEQERIPSRLKSDIPAPQKRRPGRSRQMVGLALFLILLPTFIFVMIRRSRTREIRYVENPENVLEDSLAAANAAARGSGSSRRRKPRTSHVDKAEIDKVAEAANRVEKSYQAALASWNKAEYARPHGPAPRDTASARAALLRLNEAYAEVNNAERMAASVEANAEVMKIASRLPGAEAHDLDVLHVETRALAQAIADVCDQHRELNDLYHRYLSSVITRDRDDASATVDAINGVNIKLKEYYSDLQDALEAFRDACANIYDETPANP